MIWLVSGKATYTYFKRYEYLLNEYEEHLEKFVDIFTSFCGF